MREKWHGIRAKRGIQNKEKEIIDIERKMERVKAKKVIASNNVGDKDKIAYTK